MECGPLPRGEACRCAAFDLLYLRPSVESLSQRACCCCNRLEIRRLEGFAFYKILKQIGGRSEGRWGNGLFANAYISSWVGAGGGMGIGYVKAAAAQQHLQPTGCVSLHIACA